MRLFAAFRRPVEEAAAESLYRLIVANSRQPAFYEELGVPDTPDGRYDMIVLGPRAGETPRRTRRDSVSQHVATHADATVVIAR